MSPRQRLSFLGIAAAIAVVAVIILAAGGGGDTGPGASATPSPAATATTEPQEASPGQTPTPAATPTATPAPLLSAEREQQVVVKEGDTVRLRVRAAEDDTVHVHGYDIEEDVPAGKTAEITFKATITGIFEVELHHAGAAIGRLKVEPR
jgi:FtsP/CotA-like multicopper oxidase with cupredoxin domain